MMSFGEKLESTPLYHATKVKSQQESIASAVKKKSIFEPILCNVCARVVSNPKSPPPNDVITAIIPSQCIPAL